MWLGNVKLILPPQLLHVCLELKRGRKYEPRLIQTYDLCIPTGSSVRWRVQGIYMLGNRRLTT
jgi:hypothetical protein